MDDLSSFIPMDRRRAIALGRGGVLPDRAAGAALFADISGSTPLAEVLTRELGFRRGAEELTEQLNRVYGALIGEVDRFGGSVTGFSGDAITCWFDGDEGLRAAACALAMQETIAAIASVTTPGGTPIKLGVKVAVASGTVRRFLVGDPAIQLIDLLAGATIDRLAAAEHLATRGEVLLAADTALRLKRQIRVSEWRRADGTGEQAARLEALTRPAEENPWPELLSGTLAEEQVRPWLFPLIYDRLQRSSGRFLADLRPVAALFIAFGGIDYDGDDRAGLLLDAFIRHIQAVLSRYEGALLQLSTGDKGSYLYATFGAPVAHDDDAERAVAAALDLQSLPADLNYIQDLRMGIAKGNMYAGAYGSDARRTYGVLGDKANLAARLMQLARSGEILCDEVVFHQAHHRWAFEPLTPVRVKGKAGLIRLYKTVGFLVGAGARGREETTLVGRQAELNRIGAALDALLEGKGGLLLIEGEAGIGKSRLVAELVREMRRRGLVGLLGSGQSIEQQTPYRAWRDIFTSFFDMDGVENLMERQERVRSVVADVAPDMQPRLPLINTLLNLNFPENPLTESLDPALRQESLNGLLIALLQAWARERPIVLVLEDAHWLDSLSWDLAVQAGRTLLHAGLPLLLVVVSRPLDELSYGAQSAAALRSLPGFETLLLSALTAEEVIELIAQRSGLEKKELPEEVADLVRERSGGNPFFAEELLNTLLERGLLVIEDADGNVRARVSSEFPRLRTVLPDTLQGLILARIDRLPPDRQFTLKVAAVIGRTFAFTPLFATLRRFTTAEAAALQTQLQELSRRDLTLVDAPEPELTYIFKHIITQEAAYQTLLFSQRKEIHRAVAEWYEEVYGLEEHNDRRQTTDDGPQSVVHRLSSVVYPLLVHHYHHAEDRDRERRYARLAGEQMAAQSASAEAVAYLSRALELAPDEDIHGRFELLLLREGLYNMRGEREAQLRDLNSLDRLDEALGDDRKRVEVLLRLSENSLDTGNYLASRSAAQLAISLAHRTGALDLEAEGEVRIGRALWKMADYADARAHLERGLALSRDNGLLEVEADCLLNLGIVADLIGDRTLSRAYFEQNLELRRRLGNRYREGLGLNNLGVIAWRQGNLAEAQKFFEQSLQIDREVGARSSELMPLGNLAILANTRGDQILARDYAEQSLEIAREIGDRYAQSRILGILGNAILALGEYLKALVIFEEALSLDRETGDRQDEVHRLDSLGYTYLLLGDLEASRSYYEQAVHLALEVGDRDGEGFSKRGLCLLFLYLGEVDTALEHGERALSIFQEVSDAGEQATSWTYLGHVWLQSSNFAAALDAYQHALDLCSGLQEETSSLEPHAGLARAALKQGDIKRALFHVHNILDQAGPDKLNGLDEPFRVYLTCCQVLLAGGDPGRAREILKVGCSHLQEILAGLDPARRRMFLENVPPNREFAAACEKEEQ